MKIYSNLRFEPYVGNGYFAAAVGAGRARRKAFKHITHVSLVDERGVAAAGAALLGVEIYAFFLVLDGADFEINARHELFAFAAVENAVERHETFGLERFVPHRHTAIEPLYLFGRIFGINVTNVVRIEKIDCSAARLVVDHRKRVGVVHHERGALSFRLVHEHTVDRLQKLIRVALGNVVHCVLKRRHVERAYLECVIMSAFGALESDRFDHVSYRPLIIAVITITIIPCLQLFFKCFGYKRKIRRI